ncbi:MAG: class I SAM-dependent methyltransferase [Bacteroidia bacterium]
MNPEHVIACYNKAARSYALKFSDELSKKHFDRMILSAFAKESPAGEIIDLGCGPGQTTAFLSGLGIKQIVGADSSPEMIKQAAALYPGLKFEVADMLRLPYGDSSFSAAIAFYAIVHFTQAQLRTAFEEIHRVLRPGGQFLFSFHIGDEVIRHTDFLETGGGIDFYFFETEFVLQLLEETAFSVIDVTERFPYRDTEYPSKRAYVWVEKC